MIVLSNPVSAKRRCQEPDWHAGFLELLPAIFARLRFEFRGLPRHERADAIADGIANATVAYVGLLSKGKADLAYPSVLARFAAAHYRSGRQVGTRLNINDVMSKRAQCHHGIRVDRIDTFDSDTGWREALVEDRACTPAELAASRMDLSTWFSRLPRSTRRIALTLAGGETTSTTARRYGVTPGRVSQIRRYLELSWLKFQSGARDIGDSCPRRRQGDQMKQENHHRPRKCRYRR